MIDLLKIIFSACLFINLILIIGCKEQNFVIKKVNPLLKEDFDWMVAKFEEDSMNWNPWRYGWDIRVTELEGDNWGKLTIDHGTLIFDISPKAIEAEAGSLAIAHELGHMFGLPHETKTEAGRFVFVMDGYKTFVKTWKWNKDTWMEDYFTAIKERGL